MAIIPESFSNMSPPVQSDLDGILVLHSKFAVRSDDKNRFNKIEAFKMGYETESYETKIL